MDGDFDLMNRPAVPSAIGRSRIVVVARKLPPETIDELVELSTDLVLEITMDAPTAVADIARLRGRFLTIGAGTILEVSQAQAALDAGAEFLVSPHLDEGLVEWAAARGVPIVPGAMTPSEAVRAWSLGAAALKVFPASVVGAKFIREMRGPLGHIPLIPTGGITADNARDFITAGAAAVGVGSWLTSRTGSIAGRWQQLVESVRAV
jgi:2-dehydro-3-deoxyphosphogluconate aldolase / (4S)-4-hydroxy-2-oxoglutarate aldolase